MSGTSLNPYQQWLGIAGDEAPNHYELLALAIFEQRPHIIKQQFEQRYAAVRKYQVGQYEDAAHDLLDELSSAFHCLSAVASKACYDQSLREHLCQSATVDQQARADDTVFDAENAEGGDINPEDIVPLEAVAPPQEAASPVNAIRETSWQAVERLRAMLVQYSARGAKVADEIRSDSRRRIMLRAFIGCLFFQQWLRREADVFGPRLISPVLCLAGAFVALIMLSMVATSSRNAPAMLYGGSSAILAAFAASLLYLSFPHDASLANAADGYASLLDQVNYRLGHRSAEFLQLQQAIRQIEADLHVAEQCHANEVIELCRQRLLSQPWTSYDNGEFRTFVRELLAVNGYRLVFDYCDRMGAPTGAMIFDRQGTRLGVRVIGWPNNTHGATVVEETTAVDFPELRRIAIIANSAFGPGAKRRADELGIVLCDVNQIADLIYDRIRLA
jgi:hypothetical protein